MTYITLEKKINALENKYDFNYSFVKNSHQPVILFLHGFMGNIDEFDQTIESLGDDFSYLTLDLPGHGKTKVLGGDELYKIEKTAQGVINLLDKLEIQKCYLVGYSMGGRLALYLSLHFPERFTKVVLESASPGLPKSADRLTRIKTDYQITRKLITILEKHEFREFLNNWYNQPIFSNLRNHPGYQRMLESRLRNNPLMIVKSLQFMGTGYQPSLWQEISENQVPLLLMVGKHDEKFIRINMEMFDKIPLSELKIINKAGHNVHLENTFAFVESLREFLS